MKEKISKLINKHLKQILVLGIVIVLGFGCLLVLISGNDEKRDQVPVDPTAEQQDKKDKKDRDLVSADDHPGVSDVALNLYNARVDDITDTAQVAQLLEASEMREELGGYLVTVETKNDANVLVINFEKQLHEGEDSVFDEAATWYAEQFLALIEETKEVKWTYEMKVKEVSTDNNKDKDKNKDKKEEKDSNIKKVEKSLTLEQSDELLGTETKGYSKTPELVQTLLNNQKGIV